ncbi:MULTISPECIES: acyl carrier protein [Flavobacterium]|jgi:acyl carrier protein|uniref:Acyl carrier protein n=1 Tax=Flavobacterium cupriresistens TaxID=2893885 RepID=A0ABU4R9S5_9FLAO|nr:MULTISPECIES: acyl carrier protein [unclassified Flavobacterium]KLT69213.1 acyl carrier protein [Flavobacterium sp. ABG]MDX6189337.1 acyl carrier protein [Flavobacterium sp. Fl-318]UFH41432.1 acyl carrier protein [Flavobacterium sp. F-323]
MTKEEIIAQLKVIVKPYTTNADAYETLNENTDFITDLNINSANLVDIILDIEENFGLIIDNTDMERMLNVKATVEIIATKLAAK